MCPDLYASWRRTTWEHWDMLRPEIVMVSDSICKCHITTIRIPIIKIRRSYDSLIFKMGIPILVRWCLYNELSFRLLVYTTHKKPGARFNIKMLSYQYRKSYCGDKTVVRSSYLHNGISYTGKMSSLYWIGALSGYQLWKYRLLIPFMAWGYNPIYSSSLFNIAVDHLTQWGIMSLICK